MRWFRLVSFAFLISLLAACGGTPGPSISGEMDDLGWTIGNIPANYWTSAPRPSAVIDLTVIFQDKNITEADIETIGITNSLLAQGQGWSYTADKLAGRMFTSQRTGKKVISFYNLWSDQLTANGSVIYLGTYTVTVKLKNGKISTKTLATPAPNALDAQSYSYAYSPEDFVGTPPASYAALPRRATVTSATRNTAGDALAINFSVSDPKVYSGWIEFFDANGKYLGYAGDFKDFGTKAAFPKLNNGQGLFIDGTNNLLSLGTADVQVATDVSNFTLSMIKSYNLTLTDGNQYAATGGLYDTYSYSLGTVQ